MLHLLVRPAFANPAAVRQSPSGIQRLRQALTNPASEPQLVSSQLEWLKEHKQEALPFVMKILENGSFRPWVDTQVPELYGASALMASADEYAAHWQYLKEILGPERFS